LRALYAAGAQSQLRLLLEQDDASTLTRNLQYNNYLVAARQQKMQSYLDAIQRIAVIENEIAADIQSLQALQQTLAAETTQLQTERDARKTLIASAEQDLQTKGGELEKLQQDRTALQTLIARIEQQRALAKAKEEQRLREEQQKIQQQKEEKIAAAKAASTPPTDDVSPAYSAADLERLQQQSFAQRKGKMLWPTQGKLLHQFGDNRQGSVTWDGLRIQAESGTPVRAIHGGRVMYADTLRGQGLLIVLDHGDGYMSLYAHNDALLREAGEWVQPSDVIARAGNSGGEKESALYFEIRKNGNPIDPLPWLNK
jgi:septal ring factor EnvC (AmiA/AmiB activator)